MLPRPLMRPTWRTKSTEILLITTILSPRVEKDAEVSAKPRSKAKGGDIYRVGGGEHTEADLDAMLDM